MDRQHRAAVAELRRRSGQPILDCREALQATGGDVDAALEYMKKKVAARTTIDAWDPEWRRRFWAQFPRSKPDDSK